MILYRILYEVNTPNILTPRKVENAYRGEPDTPRICCSASIEGCLSSISYGGQHLENYNWEDGSLYKLYRIDTTKYGLDDALVTPEEAYKAGVMDALLTQEYWIQREFEIDEEDVFVLEVKDWMEEAHITIPYEVMELKKLGCCKGNVIKIWDYFAEDNGKYGTDEEPPYTYLIKHLSANFYAYADCKGYADKKALFEAVYNNEIPVCDIDQSLMLI